MYALWGLTIPICPLSSYSTLGELQHLLRDSTVSRLFVHPSLLPLALDAASKIGLNPRHIYILEGHVEGRRSLGEIIDNVLSHGSKVQKAQVRPVKHDTLAYLLFSSGTSGTPKSVMVSHSNLVFQMHQTAIVNEANEVVLPVSYRVTSQLHKKFLK
jgi:long-subunit acyl-CoA synthetase (AMP-forming)